MKFVDWCESHIKTLVQLALTSLVVLLAFVVAGRVHENSDAQLGHASVQVAQGQNTGNTGQVLQGRETINHGYNEADLAIAVAALLLIALVWLLPFFFRSEVESVGPKWRRRRTGGPTMAIASMLAMAILLTACGRQGVTTQGRQVSVGASETAFVINASLPQDQVQLTDEAFLNKNKVGAGQVPITYSQFRLKTDNRLFQSDVWGWKVNNYVYVLDRAPITREWTSTSGSGTAPQNQAIALQSAESIKFSLGINCTGQVDEQDAAKFISVYSGTGRQVIKPTEPSLKDLPDAVWQVGAISAVMDNNVRGAFQGRLLGDFSAHPLDYDNANLGPIVQKAVDDITKEFKANGLTLLNCGAHGGFAYDKPEVQDAANAKFIADQQSAAKVITATNDAQAQTITNQKNIDQAKADTTAQKTRQDQELAFDKALADELRGNPDVAAYIEAQKWNGQSPQTVVGGNSNAPFIGVGGSQPAAPAPTK